MNNEQYPQVKLADYVEYSAEEMLARATSFFEQMKKRRTVRTFSDRPVDRKVIELCLSAAGRAPSGANQQPWKFVVVSDPSVKKAIRKAAEEEEQEFYKSRASEEWLAALKPLGTVPEKPFLERAPYLIVVFCENYVINEDGQKVKHYFVKDSVGIAIGMLITALHNAGLVCLTYTPSPMQFLRKVLKRPESETPVMVLVAGYPEEGTMVPAIDKKALEEIAIFI